MRKKTGRRREGSGREREKRGLVLRANQNRRRLLSGLYLSNYLMGGKRFGF